MNLYESIGVDPPPRSTGTRAVEAIIRYLSGNPFFFKIGGGYGAVGDEDYIAPRIYPFPFIEERSDVSCSPNPRQIHVWEGASRREPGTGDAWHVDIQMVIEYFSPLSNELPALGGVTIRDELMYLRGILFLGEAGRTPGRYWDPDHPGKMITTSIVRAEIAGPFSSPALNVTKDELILTFRTTEDALGRRNE